MVLQEEEWENYENHMKKLKERGKWSVKMAFLEDPEEEKRFKQQWWKKRRSRRGFGTLFFFIFFFFL